MQKKSRFVTVLSWVFISSPVFFFIYGSIFMIHARPAGYQPGYFDIAFDFLITLKIFVLIVPFMSIDFINSIIPSLGGLALLLIPLAYISSIGLLMRKNWAREAFIFVMQMTVFLLVMGLGLVAYYSIFSNKYYAIFDLNFGSAPDAVKLVGTLILCIVIGVLVWVTIRLSSDEIIEEFNPD